MKLPNLRKLLCKQVLPIVNVTRIDDRVLEEFAEQVDHLARIHRAH